MLKFVTVHEFNDSGFKAINIQPFMGFQQTFTAGSKKKGWFHRNFNVKRLISDTTDLSIRNIVERQRAKANPGRMNPEPVNGY